MFLLVVPPGFKQGPCFDIPANILYLYAALRGAGVEASWVDGNMVGMDGVVAKINELKPQFVGVTCLTPSRFSSLAVLEYAKNLVGATTVIGNAHAHWMWEQILNNYGYVDIVVFGEGERTIVDIARGHDYGEIKGIAYRRDGQLIRNAARPNIKNLDDIAFPAWDTVNFQEYRNTKHALGPRLFYSRGCTGRCKFCNTPAFWRGHRMRSPENFCEEAKWLYGLGVHHYILGDDSVPHDNAVELFRALNANLPHIAIPVQVVTRADGVSVELLQLIKNCGTTSVVFGVESGSQRILDHMNKRITVDQSREAVKMAQSVGLGVVLLIMRNIIDERPEDKRATDNFIASVQPVGVGSVNALWLFPHTRYTNEIMDGKYDHLIVGGGKGWVTDDFYLDPHWADHVIQWKNGEISPTKTII